MDGDEVFVSATTGFDYTAMTIADDVVAHHRLGSGAGRRLLRGCRARPLHLPKPTDFELCWPVPRRASADVGPAAMMLSCRLADARMMLAIKVSARVRL